jgi:L-seryl-tRNA(Ser) seleniumtransferase/D-glucosaminate-6-phosphate ammonia-lyase
MGVYEDLGLKRVINCSGKMTALGASTLHPEIVAAMSEASQQFVLLEDLHRKAGEIIAGYTGAEAACVTAGAAAGIVMGTAACMTGVDLSKVVQLPDTTGMRNEVILQKCHVLHFPVMARYSGARLVEIGTVSGVRLPLLEGAIGEKTVEVLYVVSHRSIPAALPLAEVVDTAHRHGVPVLLDAAAEEDLRRYVAMGVDLVTYSGGKAFEGPSASGFICGREDLIEACHLHRNFLGRPMKVGKEEVVGLLKALELYVHKDVAAEKRAEMRRLSHIEAALQDVPHVTTRYRRDEAGRDITRLQVVLDEPAVGKTAFDVAAAMRTDSPAVVFRRYYERQGILYIDPRNMRGGEEAIVAEKLRRVLGAT